LIAWQERKVNEQLLAREQPIGKGRAGTHVGRMRET
jgi:hypothetical protein